jgi:hypothetical protein
MIWNRYQTLQQWISKSSLKRWRRVSVTLMSTIHEHTKRRWICNASSLDCDLWLWLWYFREICRGGRDATFFSWVASGSPLEIAARMLIQWVQRSVVSERSKYQLCFARVMTDFMWWVC